MSYKKILVIQTAFPGDLILTTPLLTAVKNYYPESSLAVLVTPQTQELLGNNPHLNQVIVYDKKRGGAGEFLSVVRKLKAEKFDLALTPHRSFRSALLAHLSCPKRVGFDTSAGSFLFTNIIKYQNDKHEIERNLSLLNFTGLNPEAGRPEIYPAPEDFTRTEVWLKRYGMSFDNEIVCIAPGSIWATKRWLPEGFAQVADWLAMTGRHKVVLIGSTSDAELAEEISTRSSSRPANACGKLSWLESAALISKSKAVLSNDSAPMHLAVAMKTPVVAIFGSTVPEFGFYPFGKRNQIVQKELYCRPCGIHGKKRCPEGHFRCMSEISADEVCQALSKILNEREASAK
ncbi:MAG: lipopolysaccharide heptosyltransferase II [candidate division Zixibacteria bacterium]|nr:lipopolysaccharide heptosyltransferase II [candidate division Zixibacteria bacterium]